MHTDADDVLGDEGRKVLDACVKVKIIGRPENTRRYSWDKAVERLQGCYAGQYPDGAFSWIDMRNLLLPTEYDERGIPKREKTYDIIDIHDALVNFDEMLYVEKYPKPGPGSDELKELIDKRRADIVRECEEATADPDGRQKYSLHVAQRTVRDCYAGNFAGDMALLRENKPNPNELCNIIEIHDAVVYYNELSFAIKYPFGRHSYQTVDAQRVDVEEEYKKAISGKDTKEYSRDEAEKRVSCCYIYIQPFPRGEDIFLNERGESGMPQTTQMVYNIFDICKAVQHFDEKKRLQKFPEDEGPRSSELKELIEAHSSVVENDCQGAKRSLTRYSPSVAEKRVRGCFVAPLPEDTKIFSIKKDESGKSNIDQTYDIFDIHNSCKLILHSGCRRVEEHLDDVTEEYQKAKRRLGKYSRSEAERRVRDCFVGMLKDDTDIFPTEVEEKCRIPKTQQTYGIFEIKEALDCFDVKKLHDKYLDIKDPQSKSSNQSVDEYRAEVEREYAEATAKVEIEHGSGFIVHDHFIITNKHVIEDAVDDKWKEICISNGVIDELPCEVAYTDAVKDLALLYCQKLNLKETGNFPVQLSNQPLLPGMQVFSFGYPISHTGKAALFVNGRVSGSRETYSGHTLVVLNCALNFGNSGGPVLCWVSGQLKVVGVATQKHFKEILTLEERGKIEKVRESLQTSTIPSVPDKALKNASILRERTSFYHPEPDACQTPMFLLTLKLYDALETHSQFNLGNALPGHCVIEFVNESISKHKGEGKEELFEIVKWSEDRANILPSGHHSASDCCIQ